MAKGLRGFQNEHKTNLGNKHSKKTKDKISKSHKNKKLSKEHKKNIGLDNVSKLYKNL